MEENPLFGEYFLEDLKIAGGIRTGLLINTIYPQLREEKVVKIQYGKKTIALPRANHLSKRIAIADFVKEWYVTHHGKAFEINKALQETHMKVNKRLLNGQRKRLEQNNSSSQRFVQRTAQVYDVAHQFHQGLESGSDYSDSESDSGEEECNRGKNLYDVIAYTQHNSHYLKDIKRLLLKERKYSFIAKGSKILATYLEDNTHIQLTVEAWKKIKHLVKERLLNKKEKLTVDSFDKYFKELIEEKTKVYPSTAYRELENELQTAKERHAEELKTAKERHAEELKTAKEHHAEDLKTAKERHDAELRAAKNKIKALEDKLHYFERPSTKVAGSFFGSSTGKRKRDAKTDGNKTRSKKPKYR